MALGGKQVDNLQHGVVAILIVANRATQFGTRWQWAFQLDLVRQGVQAFVLD